MSEKVSESSGIQSSYSDKPFVISRHNKQSGPYALKNKEVFYLNTPFGQNGPEVHLAAPIAVQQDIKDVINILGIEIIDSETMPVSPFYNEYNSRPISDLPVPSMFKLK